MLMTHYCDVMMSLITHSNDSILFWIDEELFPFHGFIIFHLGNICSKKGNGQLFSVTRANLKIAGNLRKGNKKWFIGNEIDKKGNTNFILDNENFNKRCEINIDEDWVTYKGFRVTRPGERVTIKKVTFCLISKMGLLFGLGKKYLVKEAIKGNGC